MFATQVLPETVTEDSIEESDSEIIGLLVVEDKKYELKKRETKIGRDSSLCSIVIENFTISKVHAVIESEGVDDTFIYDVGSTNQTRLGKKILKPHCRYKLDNYSKLTFGNVTAKFVIPPDSQTTKPGIFDALNELEDIFDVPTQVNVIQQTTSSKVSDFEKLPENFKVFKIPHSVSPEECSTSVKSHNENKQCQLDSQQTKQRTVFYTNSLESSGIFSLGTQCQLYDPPVEQECKCSVQTVHGDGNNKNSETDKIKLLLNDGEDDVLCSVMSLHSPDKEGRLVKEINIKTEVRGLTQVFDAPTQAEVEESVAEKERKELSQILQEKDFIEDFQTTSKPSVTSTPLNNKFICPNSVCEKSNTRIEDEDLIQTQEFNCVKWTMETSDKSDNLAKETQPYLGDKLHQFDSSQQNEDLTLTQAFEVVQKNNEKRPNLVVPETEEIEDFLETQIFLIKKEIRIKGRHLQECPDLDTTCTQRNDEDDFIATQAFEETTNVRKDDENSDRNDSDDEDFIATQKVEFSGNKTLHVQEADRASRESSPDLLASDTFSKNSEDCISTQIYEPPSCQKFIKTTTQKISGHSKKENDCKIPDQAESSGDETESDLEIILNETKDGGRSHKFIKFEQPESEPRATENDDSNSSYIFELQLEKNSETVLLSDSDATDYEEIKKLVKEEPRQKMDFEETQAFTLPNNFTKKTSASNNDWMASGVESPGCESPLSLEMPNTQDIETTMNRILRRETEKEDTKTEVGITNDWKVDSPLKRPRYSNSGEVMSVKKCKTEVTSSEKLFSKLVQTHDIGQIQPSRTRNSLKTLSTENKRGVCILGNNINEGRTSRRKGNGKRGSTKNPNGDITQYLTKKVERRKRESSPNENEMKTVPRRVLRSSTRNSTPSHSPNVPTRKSKRNSNGNEYFSSPCVKVVFTGFECEVLEKIIEDLGGKKTNDLSLGEVVVTDKVRRTVKFLSAIGLGLPITSPEWLLCCEKEKKFVNPWDFILKDEEAEDVWNFELKAALEKSKKVKLLQGFSIFATKSAKPPVKDLLAIVEFCGGTPLFDFPEIWPKKTIIVSCLEDKKWWPLPKCRQVKIVHYEFILSCVLRQKIDLKTYKLR